MSENNKWKQPKTQDSMTDDGELPVQSRSYRMPEEYIYLDHHYRDRKARHVDLELIRKLYAEKGMQYFGDGTEFIAGWDENGDVMLDQESIQAAIARKAEDREKLDQDFAFVTEHLSEMTFEGDAYLNIDTEDICTPNGMGKLTGSTFIHRSSEDCPYAFAPRKLGPFPDEETGAVTLFEIDPEPFYSAYTLCPFCFKWTESMETLDNVCGVWMNAVRHVFITNKWRVQCYTPNGTSGRSNLWDNRQLAAPEMFGAYDEVIKEYQANPLMESVLFMTTDIFRQEKSLHARFLCLENSEPPKEIPGVVVGLSLYRLREDIPFEAFREKAEQYSMEDFEEVLSIKRKVTLAVDRETTGDTDGRYNFIGDMDIPLDVSLEDGIYQVMIEIAGAKMYRPAKWGIYGFYPTVKMPWILSGELEESRFTDNYSEKKEINRMTGNNKITS